MKPILLNLPEPYVKALDRMVKAGLYPSRNEAIRLAVHDLLIAERWDRKKERDRT
jgi:Arc/MetJ-type ribon-helix-helix transcriptional regulator